MKQSYRKAPNRGRTWADLSVHRFPLATCGQQTPGREEAAVMVLGETMVHRTRPRAVEMVRSILKVESINSDRSLI